MDAKTLSFGKNGEEPRVAFENIEATELYPCVMFYSTNPGEKVKITDMKVHGTQRDLLPGEPNLAPLHAVLTESYVSLLRKLHSSSSTWAEDVNEALISRLNQIETYFPSIETHNLEVNSKITDEKLSEMRSDIEIDELCINVWPALVVIGGLDRGLRMGGLCKHKSTGMKAIILGILKRGITTVNVQWESDGGISDVSISNLEYIEPVPFEITKLTPVTPHLLLHIARISGITNEISFPSYELTENEELLLNPTESKSSTSSSGENLKCRSDSQLHNQNSTTERPTTVESLTNQMVSVIMGEVKRISTEKIKSSLSESTITDSSDNLNKDVKKNIETKILERKLLDIEDESLKLAFLQFVALKVLGIFITSTSFADFFSTSAKTKPEDAVYMKEIMHSIVDKSIDQCKLPNIIGVAELERAESILHLSYMKCRSFEDRCISDNSADVESIPSNTFSNPSLSAEAGCSSRNAPSAPVPLTNNLMVRPPSSLNLLNTPLSYTAGNV